MSSRCNGICKKYKAKKEIGHSRYDNGQKFCLECELFIKWRGLWCPCCGYKMRSRPRNRRHKKLEERVYIE